MKIISRTGQEVLLEELGNDGSYTVVSLASLKRAFAALDVVSTSSTVFDPMVTGHVIVTYEIRAEKAGCTAIGESFNGSVEEAYNKAFAAAVLDFLMLGDNVKVGSTAAQVEKPREVEVAERQSREQRAPNPPQQRGFLRTPPPMNGFTVQPATRPEVPAAQPVQPVSLVQPPVVSAPTAYIPQPPKRHQMPVQPAQPASSASAPTSVGEVEIKFGPYRTRTIKQLVDDAVARNPAAISYIDYVWNTRTGGAAFTLLQEQIKLYAEEVGYRVG